MSPAVRDRLELGPGTCFSLVLQLRRRSRHKELHQNPDEREAACEVVTDTLISAAVLPENIITALMTHVHPSYSAWERN